MEQIGYIRNTSNGMAEVEVRRISGCGGVVVAVVEVLVMFPA